MTGITNALEQIAADVRYALKRWGRRPGFAATLLAVLALGIGATTAMFSIVAAVVLRPIAWPDGNRLVAIYAVSPDRAGNPAFSTSWNRGPISWPAWRALRESSAFEEVGVWARSRWVVGDPGQDSVEVWYASSSLLSLLGAEPSLGRLFAPEEDESPSSQVVLVSYECWQKRFGGRSDVVGSVAVLTTAGGEARELKTIVGVLPRGFRFRGEPPEFVLPLGLRVFSHGPYRNPAHYAIGRLATGVSVQQATAVAEQIVVQTVDTPGRRSARVIPAAEDVTGDSARPLWLLLGGAGVLLIVACANASGLLIGHAIGRRGEIGIRTALGCSRRRLVQQLTVEYVLLASASLVAGLVLAGWLVPALVTVAPDRLQGIESARVDIRTSAFALILAIGTVMVLGCLSAMFLSRTPGITALAPHSSDVPSRLGIQRLIVGTEVALGLVLVVCAALFGESIGRLTARPLGFDAARLGIVSIQVTRFPDVNPLPGRLPIDASWSHIAQILERLAALPGVVRVAGAGTAPFAGSWRTATVRPYGSLDGEGQTVQIQVVTEDYRSTMGVTLLSGRDFDATDRGSRGDRYLRVVVSRELERRAFGENAVGQRLLREGPAGEPSIVYEVIGVVGNVRHREFADEEQPTLYFLGQRYTSINDLIIRTSGDVEAIFPSVREAIRTFDADTVVTSTVPMEELLRRSVAEERFRAGLSLAFGGTALVLAALGLYGLAARSVVERRREIGVRVALGANSADVTRLVFRDAGLTVGSGLAVGLFFSVVAGRLIQSLLYNVSPTSPRSLLVASAILVVAAGTALVVPAYRATRIDPMLVLRE